MKTLLIATIAVVSSSICLAEQVANVQESSAKNPVNDIMSSHFVVTLFWIVVGVLLITAGSYLIWLTKFMRAQLHVKHNKASRPIAKQMAATKVAG